MKFSDVEARVLGLTPRYGFLLPSHELAEGQMGVRDRAMGLRPHTGENWLGIFGAAGTLMGPIATALHGPWWVPVVASWGMVLAGAMSLRAVARTKFRDVRDLADAPPVRAADEHEVAMMADQLARAHTALAGIGPDDRAWARMRRRFVMLQCWLAACVVSIVGSWSMLAGMWWGGAAVGVGLLLAFMGGVGYASPIWPYEVLTRVKRHG